MQIQTKVFMLYFKGALCVCCLVFICLSVLTYKLNYKLKIEKMNRKITDFVTLKANEALHPFVNLHSYNFTLNSDICQAKNIFLVIVTHSAPNNYRKRSLIRSTFGSIAHHKQKSVVKVFMLGAVTNKTLQEEINQESRIHGDIVQSNFIDTYANLAQKHIMGMHWYRRQCNSEYILKLDDDTFINPYRLIEYLVKMNNFRFGILCKPARKWKPVRNEESRYNTPVWQYPFAYFPDFCLGFAYITTPSTWDKLYRASETTRTMSMDDVFVTGVLTLRAKVSIFDFSDILLPCVRKNKINLEKLNKQPIVIDGASYCGDIPFRNWNLVTKTFTTIH